MKALVLAATLALIAACAAAPETVPADEKRYATGSNIPMRNRDVHTMSPEAFEQVRNSARGNTGKGPAP